MLALTECHEDRKGITAAAVGNPLVDWTGLFPHESDHTSDSQEAGLVRRTHGDLSFLPDPYKGGLPRRLLPHQKTISFNTPSSDPLPIGGLLQIRRHYFRKPESYFDPFASPLLFFRTPSAELPRESPANYTIIDQSEKGGDSAESVNKRRSPRKYPPTDSNLLLPWMRVDVGKENVLQDQGLEFVELMRRSFRRSRVERSASAQKEVHRTFEVVEREGMGLWDAKDALEIGQWFGEVLRKR